MDFFYWHPGSRPCAVPQPGTSYLNPGPRSGMQAKTRKYYTGFMAVALFVLARAVIIITIWDPFFNY